MAEIILDDTDCFIEEQNITCINLIDSHNEDSNEEEASPAYDREIEDGEVMENENNMQKETTICEIKFPDKNQFKLYGSLIINSLKDNLNKPCGKIVEIIEEDNQDCVVLIVQELLQSEFEEIPLPPTNNTYLKKEEVALPPLSNDSNTEEKNSTFEKEFSPDLSGISELFTIDTAPAPKIDSVQVPSYKRAVKDALLDEEAAAHKRQKEEENVFKIKKRNACFNCGEAGHSIRECSKPHNAKRIKNAKKACHKVERYHIDVEQRFAHLKPGCISDKLREALCLRNGEIPFFFYRMRVLGYPPGWLEDAKVEHSGINLFNSDGTKILHSDEDEGEIDPINHKYNISKIYDFPGFNQDPGENFFDDYKYHNVPPFDKRQLKEEFIKTLGDNVVKAYKRKKLKDFPDAAADDSINDTAQEATDMEIEDPETTALGEVQFTRPPPPVEQPPSPPPPPPGSSPSSCESSITVSESREREVSTQSPSLIELEKQKQRLLQELKSNTSIVEIEDSLIDEIIELDEDDKCCEQTINTNTNTNTDNSSESTVVDRNTTSENEITVIKESFMGTPLLQFSPYDNLPNGENFKVGVSDVINFENLPDSTGKYEQMKEVIKKVRNCINKLHSEE